MGDRAIEGLREEKGRKDVKGMQARGGGRGRGEGGRVEGDRGTDMEEREGSREERGEGGRVERGREEKWGEGCRRSGGVRDREGGRRGTHLCEDSSSLTSQMLSKWCREIKCLRL